MSKTIVCDGNEAAAWGVARARPDMVAVYPITPQSSLAENISQFVADGIIEADLMDVCNALVNRYPDGVLEAHLIRNHLKHHVSVFHRFVQQGLNLKRQRPA